MVRLQSLEGAPRLFETLFIDEDWETNIENHQQVISEHALAIVARSPQAGLEDAFFNEKVLHSVIALQPLARGEREASKPVGFGTNRTSSLMIIHF